MAAHSQNNMHIMFLLFFSFWMGWKLADLPRRFSCPSTCKGPAVTLSPSGRYKDGPEKKENDGEVKQWSVVSREEKIVKRDPRGVVEICHRVERERERERASAMAPSDSWSETRGIDLCRLDRRSSYFYFSIRIYCYIYIWVCIFSFFAYNL